MKTIQRDNLLNDESDLIQPGRWRYAGYLAQRLDAVAHERIRSDHAKRDIYPVTEQAFRDRIDDRDPDRPNRGLWRGEFWGKWIISAVDAARYYDDASLRDFIHEAAKGLIGTQDENGYIGTYHDSKYLTNGKNFNLWCRKHTLWGLLVAWQITGDDPILAAARRFMDHLMSEVGPDALDIYKTGTKHGMTSTTLLTPVMMLYNATGEQKYLDYARWMVEQWSKNPSGKPDLLRRGLTNQPLHTWFDDPRDWAKGYELVSCVEGMLHLYRATGEEDLLTASVNIYNQIRRWDRSAMGTISFNDHVIGGVRLRNIVAEVCDAIFWNRLSFELLKLTGDSGYLDEIERTLCNTLVGALSTDGRWGLRRVRCSHEHIRAHPHFFHNHQCCVANLPRGLFQGAQAVLLTDDRGMRVGLYQPGEGAVTLADGTTVRAAITGELIDGPVSVELGLDAPAAFQLQLRIPAWSAQTQVRLNGEPTGRPQPGSWLTIDRHWSDGDVIELDFDLSPRLEPFEHHHLEPDDELVQWHVQHWAKLGFILEENISGKVGQVTNLSPDDALSHGPAATVMRGPYALSRDRRLGDQDVFDATLGDAIETLTPIDAPEGIWRAFGATDADGRTIRLCDFGSAGNTWDKQSWFCSSLDREPRR